MACTGFVVTYFAINPRPVKFTDCRGATDDYPRCKPWLGGVRVARGVEISFLI